MISRAGEAEQQQFEYSSVECYMSFQAVSLMSFSNHFPPDNDLLQLVITKS